jgi:GNAT superfamily N-acetyltransferase
MSIPSHEPASYMPLPNSLSPDLCLDQPTSAEQTQIWKLYAGKWGKVLPLPQYLEECNLMLHVPLARNGGVTSWVLVDKNAIPDQRAILCYCRSYQKKAVVSDIEGHVQDGIVCAVTAVFCDPNYRRRGYGRRMMVEMAKKLRDWPSERGNCVGSVLYSDIGRNFYSQIGWIPVSKNTHFEFPATTYPKQQGVTSLYSADLGTLCKEDEVLMRKDMATPSDTTRLAIIADHDHMLWHHAREEFVFEKVFNRKPALKGVMVGETGKRVWAIWTHRLYSPPSSEDASRNMLYILRLVIENGSDAMSSIDQMEIKAKLETVIQEAQTEAAKWELAKVKIWNPPPLAEKLIGWMGIECKRVERENDSVASLLWYGEGVTGGGVEWVANEKYAWC